MKKKIVDPLIEAQLLEELKSNLPPNIIPDLIETQEIVTDDPSCINSVLLRFLRAEKHVVSKALHRLALHTEWRREHDPMRIPVDEIANQSSQNKVLLQPNSPVDGRPVIIIRVAQHFVTTAKECEDYVIFCLEIASRCCDDSTFHAVAQQPLLNGQATTPTPKAEHATKQTSSNDGKIWAIMDLRGVKFANCDSHALAAVFRLLSRHFPERVHKIFMLDSPFIFDLLYKAVSPFIDPVTRKKISFVYGTDALVEDIDASVLPTTYGGRYAEEVLVETVVERYRRCWHEKNGEEGEGESFHDAQE